ncbi:hypothetical protein Sinac_3315 [Singulisphaera acidiphila DSM 18658]|uniref:EF-hand domain-containing protein n=2 Tax=Singulisphaera acidiphila TaxID=466153 RepID=L0DEA5_SINAD|nr:hypothetical protein Sinac_3315 [Singulisphaera acidiphila DSM 18658]
MTLRSLGLGMLALGFLVLPARADDNDKDKKGVVDLPGPIDNLEDLQDTGRMLFMMADTNKDGQISQQEAIDAGNLLVGGYFFRADKDGNGAVSKEEADQAREALLAQRPLLRVIVQRAQAKDPKITAATRNARQGVMSLLDTNNDGQIQAPEVRQAVQSTVQSVYAVADTNRDGQMSPSEVNAALAGAARSVVQAMYQKADTDGNGQLSQAEYDKAIIEPANVVFLVLDANNDGQLSPQEFQAAERALASQLRKMNVPEPANSPKNLIESGRTPAQAAPVPNFNAVGVRPAQPQPAVQPQPAPQPRQ